MSAPRSVSPTALAIGALLAAASTFVLPAFDVALPGGSIVWQVGAVALALVGAVWARRRLPAGAGWSRARAVRLVAATAVLLALLWVGGVALLWLIWPR